MLNQLIYLFLTFFLTFILYPFWISFVYRYQMGEHIRGDGPDSHKIKIGTPTMGGFVFLVTVSVVTILLNRSRTQTLLPIFVVALAGMFGLLEDLLKIQKSDSLKSLLSFGWIKDHRTSKTVSKLTQHTIFGAWSIFKEAADTIGSSGGRGIKSYNKLLIQFTIAGFVSYWTYFKLGWDYLWLPLIGNIDIGVLYPAMIFLIFLVVMNFVAITDGLDGLAGGLGIIAFVCYWVIASQLEYNSLATLAATFVGGMLPFLYFNVYPARVFMGDVGSHVLGSALAMFAIMMHREVALLFILGVFLIDGFTSPLQQLSVKFTGKRIFRMAPFHHHFELLGWPETKVTFRFWIFGAILGLMGIFVSLL